MSFIQLKRKSGDDPKEILILANKKRKIENIKEDASVFELAGTATQKDEIENVITKRIQGFRYPQVKKFDLEKFTDRLRIEHLQHSKHNRLQVLNCKRDLPDNVEKAITVIDLSNEEENSSQAEQEDNFVYDIYYSQSGIDVSEPDFVKNYSVHEVNGLWQDNTESEDENEVVEDEDDSNDENNWRNDYPDEEEYGLDSNDEEDFEFMSRKLKNSRLSDESLSSDEFDEAINDDLFNLHRKNRTRKDSDIDYFNEVASDSSDSS